MWCLRLWCPLGLWLTAKCCSADAAAAAPAAAAAASHAPQRLLRQCNAVDFNDLLDLCMKMFTDKPEILQQQQALRPFLLVDEFQDSNKPQVCPHVIRDARCHVM
jgi:superfamily I DNA/RNA helicase